MQSGDHLGNAFSDMEEEDDSFDAPVYGSKSFQTEEKRSEDESEEGAVEEQRELDLEEEDFNLLTIEKVPLDVLTARIGRVISEVIYRGEPAAIALFDVANKIIFQSTMLDVKKNTVINTIIHGLTCMIIDERERDQGAEQSEHILMLFITKLSIKNKSMKCSDLLYQLILLVDRLYLHADSFVRSRIYRLIACLMEESNRYADIMREHGDDVFLFTNEDPPEEESMIPNGVRNRWMGKLAKSLLDKSPQVRSKAVVALSLWDHDAVHKTNHCDEVTINELLWKSVHDVDDSVRLTAARRIHIVDENDIDKCIDYVETCKDNKVKQAIIIRLASDVHLFSFSEKQRFRLVNLLNESDSARVQDVIHQRLVESWMKVAGEEIVCPSMFSVPQPDHKIPNQFPSIILEYLDPLVDPTAVYVFMKFAIVRFIRLTTGQQDSITDIDQLMKDLLQMNNTDSDCVGLMRRSSFRLVAKDSDPDTELKNTFARILISRCFVDIIFDITKGSLNALPLRNRALMFFLPDVTTFVEHLEQFCSVYFDGKEQSKENCRELLLYNIFHLINKAVKYGDVEDDANVYKKTLMRILEEPTLDFSTESIVTMVTTCLDLCKHVNENEEFCEWICGTANKLMLYESGVQDKDLSLDDAMKNSLVLDRMYLRSATMLLATCEHEEVKKPTTSMSVLFRTIIPALLGNKNEVLQKVGLELIGFATSIDFVNCEPYLKLTRFLIERDDEVLKSTGLHTLVRVIKARGFPRTAEAIFQETDESPQDCQDSLAKLFEKTIISLQGIALVQAVQDCFSMLSYGQYAWSKLISALLLIVFQRSNESFPLVKVFMSYCKKSVQSDFNKLNLLLGYARTVNIISKTSEHDSAWNLENMTALVCDYISSVPTVDEDERESSAKNDGAKEIFMEIEIANRMVNRAVSQPSAWFTRHVFTAMATSLRLECVPMEQLDKLHEYLVDSYTIIRFNSGKTTQIAFKRFLTHCEKVITLHERMKGLKIGVDLKKVKKEISDFEEGSMSMSSSSSSGRKRVRKATGWDDDGFKDQEDNTDDSFEYFPKSTRTRKRPYSGTRESPSKKVKKEVEDVEDEEDEEINIEDSFEL